ncbi:MAG: hypothetical protein IKZ58_01500 [Selenomonadaceae bacterium]|nr:hypothetical protein [Selenomonadaceae bacterium]
MKKFFVSIIFLFGMILTTTASAANWVSFGSDSFGNEYFIDTLSVHVEEQGFELLIFNADFKTVFSDEGRTVFSNDTLGEAISVCSFKNKGRIKLISTVSTKYFALDGTVIAEDEEQSTWQAVKPNSLLQVMYDTAYEYLKL